MIISTETGTIRVPNHLIKLTLNQLGKGQLYCLSQDILVYSSKKNTKFPRENFTGTRYETIPKL